MFDGRPTLCNKIDGVTPFIFPKRKNVKILFLSAVSIRNITTFSEMLYTDDKNITYKMLKGILDMHAFYLNNKSTNMSHYIDNSFTSTAYFFARKLLMCIIVMLINIYSIIHGNTNISHYYLIVNKLFHASKHTFNPFRETG